MAVPKWAKQSNKRACFIFFNAVAGCLWGFLFLKDCLQLSGTAGTQSECIAAGALYLEFEYAH